MANGFDWQAVKARSRRIVHDTFGGDATYFDSRTGVVNLTVRWHNKIEIGGDLENSGYSQVIEGVDRVVFDRVELANKGITLRTGGVVTMADKTVLHLSTQEPIVGPVEVIWNVTRGG